MQQRLIHVMDPMCSWCWGFKPVLDEVASAHGVSRAAVAMAWLMKHPAGVMPICGSTKPDRIRDVARAASVRLSRDEWYRLFTAAAGKPPD